MAEHILIPYPAGSAHRCGEPMAGRTGEAWNAHALTCTAAPDRSPIALHCPTCGALPGHYCDTSRAARGGAWSCRAREALQGVDTRPVRVGTRHRA